MMPFTFQEFCEFKGIGHDSQSLREYVTWGGFPLVCSADTDDMRYAVLSNLYDSIVLKDIILRNKVSSPHLLENVLEYLIGSSSLTVSGNSIAYSLKKANLPISAPTVYEFIKFCTDACILSKVERYDIRGKKALSFEEKIYVADLGFFQLKKNRVKDEFSLVAETIVYNELIARGYQVYIGKTQKGEIDFIAQKQRKTCYVQVAYRLDSQNTIDREFGAYDSIKDHYPKYVISFDDVSLGDQNGIVHIPLHTFLTHALPL
jgi:predicted AAA+ superfamily ATPase